MLNVSAAPHLRSGVTTQKLMRDVFIALLPAAAAGVIFFGSRALFIMVISVLSAALAEGLTQRLMKRPVTVSDGSACITGLLLAMNLPPTAPLWLPVVGSAFAIVIVKQLFGGIGHNFMNPALAARAMLMASWPVRMTSFVSPSGLGFNALMSASGASLDALTSATPLALAKGIEAAGTLPSYMDLFLGNMGGCIGEVSKVALLIGAAYLIVRKTIDWRIPLSYIGSLALLSFIIGPSGIFTGDALFHVLSGGALLGACFMATDYATSPATKWGRVLFGLGGGVLACVIRLFGSYPEGVSYSILIMNVAAPLLERATRPHIYGRNKQHA